MVKGHRLNHVLHLLLSIVTLGLWLIVWILLASFGGETRWLVKVDEYGNVSGLSKMRTYPIHPPTSLPVAPTRRTPGTAIPPAAREASGSIAELERLADLHERGSLTDEEFAQAKARILGGS